MPSAAEKYVAGRLSCGDGTHDRGRPSHRACVIASHESSQIRKIEQASDSLCSVEEVHVGLSMLWAGGHQESYMYKSPRRTGHPPLLHSALLSDEGEGNNLILVDGWVSSICGCRLQWKDSCTLASF